MTLGAAIALAVGISVPILLGLVTYVYQERQSRRVHLAKHKELVYTTLIRNLVGLIGTHTPRDRSRLLTEIERAWLFASDDVLEACYEYIEYYDRRCCSAIADGRDWSDVLGQLRSDPEERRELRDKLAEVFVAMRRDLRGEKRSRRLWRRKHGTGITLDWALQHFDIYRWGILAAVEEDGADASGPVPPPLHRAASSAAGT